MRKWVRGYCLHQENIMLERTQAVLLAIAGTSAGKLFLLEGKSEFTIGCAQDCDIYLTDANISWHHAKLRMNQEGHGSITDLETVGGIWVDGVAVSQHTLVDGAIIRIGSTDVLKFTYINDLEKSFYLDQYRKIMRDDLTGAFNRRYFQAALCQGLAHACHWGKAMSLILIDIDHFKRINDSCGHLAGDAVLEGMVAVIRENLSEDNILARYGGEEFGIILQGQGASEAYGFANRIRDLVERTPFNGADESFYLTISAGIAIHDGRDPPKDPSEMLAEADKQLYRAKAAGGNRVFWIHP